MGIVNSSFDRGRWICAYRESQSSAGWPTDKHVTGCRGVNTSQGSHRYEFKAIAFHYSCCLLLNEHDISNERAFANERELSNDGRISTWKTVAFGVLYHRYMGRAD